MSFSEKRIIRDALKEGSLRLNESETPWLDASLLLAYVMGCRREKILASYPDVIKDEVYTSFMKLIDQRQAGFPVAYLTGSKEFFGRPFYVKQGILCPRPDTEILIEEALTQIQNRGYTRIHDLCTGSGCIALTLKLENPELQLSASDVSPISEAVFKINKEKLHVPEVPFLLSSLFDGLEGPLDLIVSNPPYLTSLETKDRMDQNWKEPALALDGGDDGLDLIKKITEDSPSLLSKGGCL